MKRGPLKEAFHGEGDGSMDATEAQATAGKEELIVDVQGTLGFLTETGESDDDAMKAARFVRGELKMENGKVFSFWMNSEGRSGTPMGDMSVYADDHPQTG
ncbi:MAG: hypothetical protein LC737_00445 [Chloroflexi bacterium]|nr:hypothetical protein [Chloroflexota bacterium]